MLGVEIDKPFFIEGDYRVWRFTEKEGLLCATTYSEECEYVLTQLLIGAKKINKGSVDE